VKESNQNLLVACATQAASAVEHTDPKLQKIILDNDVSLNLRLVFDSEHIARNEKHTHQDEIWSTIKKSVTREESGHFSVALPWRLPRE